MSSKPTYEELEQRVRELEQTEIDRKQAEERIRFLFSAMEQSSEGMAIADTEGNLIHVNQAWVEMHGYESPKELVGRHLSIFHNSEQLKNEVEPFNAIVMKNGYCKGEVGHIRKDGTLFPTLMTSTLLKDESGKPTALSGIAKDITDIKRAEEKLKAERDTLQGLTDGLASTGIGVDVVGVDYKILHQNKLLMEVFGDLTGKLCYENYMGLNIPCDPCPMVLAIKSGKVERAEMTGGDGRHYEIFSAPLTSVDGGVDKAIEVVLDITERKKAEEVLRENELFLRTVLSAAPVGIGLVRNRIFTWVSDRFLEMVGYSRDDLMGESSSIVYESRAEYERVGTEKYLEIEKSGWGEIDTRLKRKDGSSFDVHLRSVPLDPKDLSRGVIFAATDISLRKQMEQELKKDKEKYRDLVENINDVIYSINKNGKITYMSPVLKYTLGYDPSEVIGRNFIEFVHKDDLQGLLKKFQEVLEGQLGPSEYRLLGKSNEYHWVRSSSRPVYEGDRVVGLRGSFTDISEGKRLEAQLQQAQKMEAIGTLAGGIAHDFNNILSAVIGYTDLALDDVESGSPLHAKLSEVLAAGNRAKDLVKQILAFSRIEEEAKKPFQINPLIKEALKMLRSTIPASIEIRTDICGEPLIMHGDPTQIHQVMVNLATNAMHAMTERESILEVGVEPISFDESSARKYPDLSPGNYARLTVSDTGAGISEEDLDKIFEPYFTTKEKGTGTGLGLSMVHGIVKAHKGHITVYSEPGKGTTFHVFLPLAGRRSTELPTRAPKPLPTGTERILLVDDEPPIADMQQQILEQLGYTVTARTGSLEALEAFRSSPGKFDLVITDMTMPNMTGDTLAHAVKEIRADVPVILCTGFSKKVNGYREDLEIDGFLMKPVDKAKMAETVRKVLDKAVA